VPRASIENRRSWTVLLLLRVRRLDRVSKARRADGGLLFKTPWSCVCVCVWAPAPCLASGIWSFLRLTVLACGHGNVAGMGILWELHADAGQEPDLAGAKGKAQGKSPIKLGCRRLFCRQCLALSGKTAPDQRHPKPH
jgi:hypothetical protein